MGGTNNSTTKLARSEFLPGTFVVPYLQIGREKSDIGSFRRKIYVNGIGGRGMTLKLPSAVTKLLRFFAI